MAKEFINAEQKEELNSKGWEVRPSGFRLTHYRAEHNHGVWKKMCEIAEVSSRVSEFTTVSVGVIAKL